MYVEYLQFTQIVIFPGNSPPPCLCSLCPLQKIGVWCMYWCHLSQSENKIVSSQPIAAGEQTTLLKEAVQSPKTGLYTGGLNLKRHKRIKVFFDVFNCTHKSISYQYINVTLSTLKCALLVFSFSHCNFLDPLQRNLRSLVTHLGWSLEKKHSISFLDICENEIWLSENKKPYTRTSYLSILHFHISFVKFPV